MLTHVQWYNCAHVWFCRVTSRNEIETTGIESERPVVWCGQRPETTECKR